MKKQYLVAPLIGILLLVSTHVPAQTASTPSKVLVVYFSRVGVTSFGEDVDVVSSASLRAGKSGLIGNTEMIANMVQEAAGGDLFQIVTVTTYPENYRETIDMASREQRQDARPELATHIENMDAYDVIVLCYPNWWGTIPMPVFTFLEEYDFSGKSIAPLCTHKGSRLGSSVRDIARLCPNATILDGLAVQGDNVQNAQNEVVKWLRKLNIL